MHSIMLYVSFPMIKLFTPKVEQILSEISRLFDMNLFKKILKLLVRKSRKLREKQKKLKISQ